MMLKLRRIAVVLTAALTLAAATIPTNEAFGFLLGPALLGSAFIGAGGYGRGAWGGGGPVGTTPVGAAAAAAKSGLRLRRGAVTTAVGAGDAAVGMATVTVAGNLD